jgi:hypothetical protein
MMICCSDSVRRMEIRKQRRQTVFEEELMPAVWRNDVQAIVRVLSRDPSLVRYRGFVFHLPAQHGVTRSILDYAEVLGHQTAVEVLNGFLEGAR